ncbi:hypothetical protein E4U42_001791 [Claviceps africana]|uniref:Uncharacterized protein n=1 Tax=Claviceps africana TaxID=83212 RepID=A0A8K0JF08_9HYPO|nr:hypothetical protein E4U42_001791 [Claviceps africana]
MAPVADLPGIAVAATSLSSDLATEHPNRTPAEQCNEEQEKKSSYIRRRSRKQSTRSSRKRRSRDVEKSENGESEDETEEPAAIPIPYQAPPSNQRNKDSPLPHSTSSASPTRPVSKATVEMPQEPQEPPLPPAPTPLTLANPSSAKTPSEVSLKLLRAANVLDPVPLPPDNLSSPGSGTVDPAYSTLSASTTWSISLSSTTGWSLPTAPADITTPNPSIFANTRKEVKADPLAEPVATPHDTAPSPTSLLPGDDHHEQNDLPSANAEKALITVGSIAGVLIIGFLSWLVWWISKRRRNTAKTREHPPPPFPEDTPRAKRRLFVRKTLTRIPILKKHINGGTDNGWTNLDHSYVGPTNDTAVSSTAGAQQQPSQAPTIVVRTEIVRKSFRAGRENTGAHARVPEQQPVSCAEAQHNHAPGLGVQACKTCPSDNSSLSSGFGDGQFMMNNNNDNNNNNNNQNDHRDSNSNALDGAYRSETPAAVVTTINAPSFPTAKRDSASMRSERGLRRDTVCTEASEDLPPRFRTVHSWVRQQSSRVVRAKQRVQSPSASEATTPSGSQMPP